MRLFHLLVVAILCGQTLAIGTIEDARFVQVSPIAAVANEKLARELKELVWPSAQDVWVPNEEETLGGLAFIQTVEGQSQIVSKAPADTDMRPCLERMKETRFQVFGFIIQGRRCILYSGIPATLSSDRRSPDLWLKESISLLVFDGGASFWSVLYDFDNRSVVSTGRRPD